MDAARRGRLGASTFVTLRRALQLGSAALLALVALALVGDGGIALPTAAAGGIVAHALALFVASTPPEAEVK